MHVKDKAGAVMVSLLSIASLTSAVSPRQLAAAMMGRALPQRQSSPLPACRYVYAADIFTTCQQYLWTFGINLDYFRRMNPEISSTCDNFVRGKAYCLIRASDETNVPVSQNGRCGADQNFTTTCVGSQFGDCCGSGGYCGSGNDFCGKGNCQEGDCDGDVPYSIDGTCGRDHDFTECPPKFGNCCSVHGFCGSTEEFCGSGCQSGHCSSSSSSTSLPPSTPTQAPGSVSRDGTCGYNNQLVCTGSQFGDCCSAAGYCGSTEYYCSGYLGCQSGFGRCNGTSDSPTTTSGGSSTRTTTRSSSTVSTVPAPSPTQPNSIHPSCNKYAQAKSGDYCWIFAQNNGISTDQLYAWNTVLGSGGSNCGNLWADYYYCVGIAQ